MVVAEEVEVAPVDAAVVVALNKMSAAAEAEVEAAAAEVEVVTAVEVAAAVVEVAAPAMAEALAFVDQTDRIALKPVAEVTHAAAHPFAGVRIPSSNVQKPAAAVAEHEPEI